MAAGTTQASQRRADASPTKAFFVRMLTRDISLDDCILDLIDNSIDSAWSHAGVRPTAFELGDALSNYTISINFDEERFVITDNCGGISLDDAADYAFTFGRKDVAEGDDPRDDFTVGVYGIGMKRAVFKIGEEISIRSTHVAGDVVESFLVPIRVRDWLADESTPWDFDIEDSANLPSPGVEIEVLSLTEEATRRFLNPTYERTLMQMLGRDYLLPLMQGLTIEVNGSRVDTRPLQLLSGDSFSPMRKSYSDSEVNIEIIAGMHAVPPDDNEPESSREDRTSGWYVVCNGRVVLAADRSGATGWGVNDFPRWHGQYSGFVGMVLFSAANPALLPMTTTKRHVDASSAVYQRAVNEMTKPARAWVDYTNARKAALEQAKKLEISARPVNVAAVPQEARVKLPNLRPSRAKIANVNYSVPLTRMKALANAFGDPNLPYREVGLRSFDYTYDDHVDEDV